MKAWMIHVRVIYDHGAWMIDSRHTWALNVVHFALSQHNNRNGPENILCHFANRCYSSFLPSFSHTAKIEKKIMMSLLLRTTDHPLRGRTIQIYVRGQTNKEKERNVVVKGYLVRLLDINDHCAFSSQVDHTY